MDAEALIGRQPGTSTLQRVIGSGTLGAVYLGQQSQPSRQVAVKVFLRLASLELRRQRAFLTTFRDEMACVFALKHPNILPVYDHGDLDGLTYIVTPYVVGETLEDVLERVRALPLQVAANCLQQIAAGASAGASRRAPSLRDRRHAPQRRLPRDHRGRRGAARDGEPAGGPDAGGAAGDAEGHPHAGAAPVPRPRTAGRRPVPALPALPPLRPLRDRRPGRLRAPTCSATWPSSRSTWEGSSSWGTRTRWPGAPRSRSSSARSGARSSRCGPDGARPASAAGSARTDEAMSWASSVTSALVAATAGARARAGGLAPQDDPARAPGPRRPPLERTAQLASSRASPLAFQPSAVTPTTTRARSGTMGSQGWGSTRQPGSSAESSWASTRVTPAPSGSAQRLYSSRSTALSPRKVTICGRSR